MHRELRPTVLLVDDEANFVTLVAEGLRRHSATYHVETARHGGEALEVLERQRVDLVITDLDMPEMDGFELTAEISQRFPSTAVIVLSALGDPITHFRAIGAGAYAFLDKPVDFQLLAERIELHLARSAAGVVRGITLPSFLQLLAAERKTCRLRLAFGQGEARLYFESGDLVHAEAGSLVGEEAVFALVAANSMPWMEIEPYEKPTLSTIRRSVTHLLLEAARLDDEEGASELDLKENDGALGNLVSGSAGLSRAGTRVAFRRDDPHLESLVELVLRRSVEIPSLGSAAVVELQSGGILGASGVAVADLADRAAAIAEVLRGMMASRLRLVHNGEVEEMWLSTPPKALLVRPLPMETPTFLLLSFDTANPNIGLARLELREIFRELRSVQVVASAA